MREKTIFDGRIDGSSEEVQEIIDFFLFQNLGLPGIDYRVEIEKQKHIYVIYPQSPTPQTGEKIINGYTEIATLSLSEKRPVSLRIVSCRIELDLLFFQISQRIQAKFILEGFPPEVLTTPWRELINKGVIVPLPMSVEDVLLNRYLDPKDNIPKYGRHRDLSKNAVMGILKDCRAYKERGGTYQDFYNTILRSELREKFDYETLRSWLRNFK